MVSLKQKQSGFTIVELLIVIVIIGILAGLVIATVANALQRGRNAERQSDLAAIATQLEVYFAKNSAYPSLADLNTGTWRTGNELKVGDADKALADPSTPTQTSLVATVTAGRYSYVPTPATCVSPTDGTGAATSPATPCTGYALTAVQEGGAGNLVKNNSN